MRIWPLLVLAAACDRGAPPIDDKALVGDWQYWCTPLQGTTCLGKDPHNEHWVFAADGTMQMYEHGETRNTVDWKLHDGVLDIMYRNAGATDSYRARLDGGRLVLHHERYGTDVYGRPGVPITTPTRLATEHGAEGVLRGVHYTLRVPAGSRLGLDEPDSQRWEPPTGDGFTYEVKVTERLTFGGVAEPCRQPERPLPISGVGGDHEYSTGTTLCVPGTNLELRCSAEHTRGYLEQSELDPANAVCQTLTRL